MDDPELEREFSIARREAQRRTPEFARMWGEAGRISAGSGGRSARPIRLAAGAAAILAVTMAGLLLWNGRGTRTSPRAAAEAEATITSWKAPTDFLLETPGIEILTTLPAIGPAPPFPSAEDTSNEASHVN